MQFFIKTHADRLRAHTAIDAHELPFRVKLSKGGRRSIEQNAYLWGVCYETILAHGLRDEGWRNEDLHEYFLGEHFGWEKLKGLPRTRVRPVRRSSGLNKAEFSDYIAFIHEKAAGMGVYIPDPEENYDSPD